MCRLCESISYQIENIFEDKSGDGGVYSGSAYSNKVYLQSKPRNFILYLVGYFVPPAPFTEILRNIKNAYIFHFYG